MVNQDPLSVAVSGVVVVVLVDFLRAHQGWGWMRLVQGASAFKDTPGLLFTKVMGSGHEGGFGLRPSSTHQGLLCVFDSVRHAEGFMAGVSVQQYMERAKSCFTAMLAVTSVRGAWDGRPWGVTTPEQLGAFAEEPSPDVAMVALTRASIRPAKALAFWRFAPGAQDDLKTAPGCELAMGLGEAPLVRQCTFSLWKDTQSMLQYAHTGAHQQAIAAAYKHEFFSESMFARMRVLRRQGDWPNMTVTAKPVEEASHG